MSVTAFLFATTLKSSVALVIAVAAVSALRRQSAAMRHWMLASAVACAALIPALGPLVPAWQLPISTVPAVEWFDQSADAGIATERMAARAASDAAKRSEDLAGRSDGTAAVLARAIVPIWLAGVAVSMLVLVAGLGRLASIASRARPVDRGAWLDSAAAIARELDLRAPVRLLQTNHPTLLVTWGALRPSIMLPRAAERWPADRIRAVLAHELAHVKRHDWLIHMLGEAVRAFYWFNPLVWLACRRLRDEGEHAADDVVLSQGMNGPDYAGHLVHLARVLSGRRAGWLPAAAIAPASGLERRVRAMLNDHTNRAPATRSARLITLAAASCMTVALAAAQSAFATFSGTVFDETNGFMPGVTLTLTKTDAQAKYEVKSDSTGHFEFVGLPPGDYQLETKIAGFATLRGTMTLRGQDAQRDLVLQIGSLEETIRVTGPGTSPWSGRAAGSTRPERRPDPTCGALVASGMGGNVRAPRKLVDVKPFYPQQLYDAKIGGTLVLQALIDTEGRVGTVEVVSPAHPELNAAAIDAVRQWEFDPTILNCSKVEVRMKVNVTFAPQ